ncbi:MAG: hypothetical protein CMO81_10320 [Waddliaceae bacterium]|nr:hypothetical protein [Waddliaceae bacterium]
MQISTRDCVANLQELFYWQESRVMGNNSLVSNKSATRIYVSQRGWGRLWSLYYKYYGFFSSVETQKTSALKTVIERTINCVEEQVKQLEKAFQAYASQIQKLCSNQTIMSSHFCENRWKIQQWNEQFSFLNQEQVLKTLPLLFSKASAFSGVTRWFQWDSEQRNLLKKTHQSQKILDWESRCQCQIPYRVLFKLSHDQKLTKSDYARLREFVELTLCDDVLATSQDWREFISAFIELSSSQKESSLDIFWRMASLVWYLVEEGIKEIRKENIVYRQRYQVLGPNIVVDYNGKKYTITKPYIPKTSIFRVYEVLENPDILLVFAENPLEIFYFAMNAEKRSWAIPIWEILSADFQEGILLVEKPLYFLNKIPWSKSKIIHEYPDGRCLKAFKSFIDFCKKEGKMPEKYNLAHSFINRNFHLCTAEVVEGKEEIEQIWIENVIDEFLKKRQDLKSFFINKEKETVKSTNSMVTFSKEISLEQLKPQLKYQKKKIDIDALIKDFAKQNSLDGFTKSDNCTIPSCYSISSK